MAHSSLLPVIPFGPRRITRLIVGGNPFRGNSHQNPERDREMESYFTVARIKEVLATCENTGINAVQARGDVLIQACMREHWAEGGSLFFIAQTASELRDLDNHARQLARFGAIGIYVHGTFTDRHFQNNTMDEVRRLLETIRETGARTGIGTHIPEVVEYIDEHDWKPDFFMTSLYNLSRTERESALVSGRFVRTEHFNHQDRYVMFDRIRATAIQCLVFKVLGAGRLCKSSAQVEQVLTEVYANIKSDDAVVLGVFPRDHDQVSENVRIVSRILCG